MNDRIFNLNSLPDLPNSLSSIASEINKKIINSYMNIKSDALKMLNCCLENRISKPLTIYQLFYYIEISFKLKLLESSYMKLTEIDACKQNICMLMKHLKDIMDINFSGFMYRIKKIKNKDGVTVDFLHYYDFKYNREFNSINLIFNSELTEDDIKQIKDVIKWLNTNV